jgi:hypothetical protein
MAAFAFAASRLIQEERWLPRGLALAGSAAIAVGVFWLANATIA